ncbi:CAP domain-containing protein [Mesorhizobium sp. CN2-181]|uniref:CAP domain-containing protein n=1 Tax=Mesorhizobium yinganensis TaxID=3157707 RepID=UPI0032B744E8
MKSISIDRRWFLAASLISLGLTASGCRSTVLDIGEGAVASSAGQSYLAQIRSSNGLPPLSADPTLGQAALHQAEYMARSGRMAHTTGWGKDFVSRMRADGVRGAAAENVAFGDMGPEEVFSRWMNSAGHRRNMLDPAFSRFGLAYVREAANPQRRYWALVLAS